jgi:hypothetical protein
VEELRLDFFGVGAAKAGTTWLYECLREHPHVCMSDRKELHYFCSRSLWPKLAINRHEGEEWLRARFAHCEAGKLRGEISVSYLVDPSSPELIKERFPEAKIIITYRNPVETLRSLYYQISRRHSVGPTLERFIEQYPYFIPYGFYYEHTVRYLQWFSRERVHMIVFDDIRDCPESVIAGLYRFLGVDASWQPSSLHQRVNVGQVPRSRLIRNLIGLGRTLVSTDPDVRGVRKVVRLLRLHYLGDWIQNKNLRAAALPPMRTETKKLLIATYSEQNALLGQLLGRDLSHWNE